MIYIFSSMSSLPSVWSDTTKNYQVECLMYHIWYKIYFRNLNCEKIFDSRFRTRDPKWIICHKVLILGTVELCVGIRGLKGQYHHFDEIWHCIGPTFLVRELKTDPRSSTPLSRYRRSKYERCTTLWIVLHYLHCLNVCAVLNWPPVIKLLPWSFHQIL